MHGASLWFVVPGLLGFAYTMLAWWSDVIKESNEGFHTKVVQLGLRYGMILFIASEVMFFVAWFWAFFDSSLSPGSAIQVARAAFTGGHWPPTGPGAVEVFDPWHLPLLNTLILLTSGTTVTWAHHALIHNDRKGPRLGASPAPSCSAPPSPASRSTNTPTPPSTSAATSTAPPSSWRPASTVSTSSWARCSCWSACSAPAAATSPPEQHFGFEAAAW